MPDFSKFSDPNCNPNFSRRWVEPFPSSPSQRRLSELRDQLGNAAGQQAFAEELRRERGAWLR